MNFDPIHWACVGLGIVLVLTVSIGGAMYWKQGKDLEVCKAEAAAFSAQTEAAGTKSELERVTTEHALANAAVNIQGDLNAKQAELDRVYTEYDRLRRLNKGSAGSSQASSLAESTRGLSCPDRSGEFAAAMERLEDGIIPILKSRDTAINRTVACKVYLEKVQQILNDAEEISR